MKRALALLATVVMAAMFGSATLASADCAYHTTQAALDKADTAKKVATVPTTDRKDAEQLKTAEVIKPVRSTAEVKR